MSLQPITEQWRTNVCAILRTADPKLIQYTADALYRFEAAFPDAFRGELEDAFRAHLQSNSCTGCPVIMAKPAGTTWEFYFTFRTQKLYGKILLRSDLRSIIIFSAHPPLKPRLSCE